MAGKNKRFAILVVRVNGTQHSQKTQFGRTVLLDVTVYLLIRLPVLALGCRFRNLAVSKMPGERTKRAPKCMQRTACRIPGVFLFFLLFANETGYFADHAKADFQGGKRHVSGRRVTHLDANGCSAAGYSTASCPRPAFRRQESYIIGMLK